LITKKSGKASGGGGGVAQGFVWDVGWKSAKMHGQAFQIEGGGGGGKKSRSREMVSLERAKTERSGRVIARIGAPSTV
jgi:hypothetical protein